MPRSTDGGTSGDEAISPRAATRPKKSKSTTTTSCPSPTSSSSSDFEFTVSLSPTSKRPSAAQLCPADELFYKGQLLPLHLSPRISMVRSLLLSSASTSSASGDSSATSRDSNGSTSSSFSADFHLLHPSDSAPSSSRPSSVTDDEALPRNKSIPFPLPPKPQRSNKYLSSLANRFSSVFLPRGNSTKKDVSNNSVNKIKPSPKEMLKKYVKKVKPLYEKLSSLPQKQSNHQNQSQNKRSNFSFSIRKEPAAPRELVKSQEQKREYLLLDHLSNSFSGNLKYPRRKRCAASCPSSMRSSPSHSGLLSFGGGGAGAFPDMPMPGPVSLSTASSMEELQSAIEGAIAHCKSSLGGQKKVAIGSVSFGFDGDSFVDC